MFPYKSHVLTFSVQSFYFCLELLTAVLSPAPAPLSQTLILMMWRKLWQLFCCLMLMPFEIYFHITNPKTQKDSTFHRTFLCRGALFLYLFRRVSSIVTLNFGLYFIVSTVIINSRQARWTWTAFQINVGHRWLVSSSWLRSSNKIEMMMDCWIMT